MAASAAMDAKANQWAMFVHLSVFAKNGEVWKYPLTLRIL